MAEAVAIERELLFVGAEVLRFARGLRRGQPAGPRSATFSHFDDVVAQGPAMSKEDLAVLRELCDEVDKSASAFVS